MKTRSEKNGLLLLLVLGSILAILVLMFTFFDRIFNQTDENNGDLNYGQNSQAVIYYNSVAYVPKESLETVLFIGLDATEEIGAMTDPHLADFLMLAIMDHESKNVLFLHLNRDTMAYINQLDYADNTTATLYTQLARGHIFGSSETVRCHNTVKTVERLLYDIDIDHYVSMTMGAVSRINDAVGGITLPLLADFTHVDPAYTEGTEVTLKGDFALTYIRARGSMEDKTNLARMERQKQYMEQLLTVYLENMSADSDLQTKLVKDVSPYIHTDLTAHQMARLSEKIQEYSFSGTDAIPGEAKVGDEFMEYYVDETALQEKVLSLFYREYTEE
ncbi:MAG: hypothetical protein E7604_12615 [Ruminococcaceae bacterium]|nr:hypothetical protein [Oscillospiraceae bacterium]